MWMHRISELKAVQSGVFPQEFSTKVENQRDVHNE